MVKLCLVWWLSVRGNQLHQHQDDCEYQSRFAALGIDQQDTNQDRVVVLQQITEERGWPWNALHLTTQMQRRGLDVYSIVAEVINIEITLWQRLYELPVHPNTAND